MKRTTFILTGISTFFLMAGSLGKVLFLPGSTIIYFIGGIFMLVSIPLITVYLYKILPSLKK